MAASTPSSCAAATASPGVQHAAGHDSRGRRHIAVEARTPTLAEQSRSFSSGARERQHAMQTLGAPIEGGTAAELALDAGADHPRAITLGARRGNRAAARLAALEHPLVGLELPIEPHLAGGSRQRAVFGRVGGELV